MFFSATQLSAQNILEFAKITGDGNPAGNGPAVSTTINFLQNTTGNTFVLYNAPALSATVSFVDQRYDAALISSPAGSIMIGHNGVGASPVYAISPNAWYGVAGGASFTSANAPERTGISITDNYAIPVYNFVRAIGNTVNFRARLYVGRMEIVFSRAVTNPILHFSGLGGSVGSSSNTKYFSTDLDMNLSQSIPSNGLTLTKLSSNSTFVLTGNSVTNNFTPVTTNASGSIQINGTNIQKISFDLYLDGWDGNANTVDYWTGLETAGDAFSLSMSVAEPDIIANNDSFGVVTTNSTTTASVFANDLFNGAIPTASNVSVTAPGLPAGITMNPNGTLNIASTTLPKSYQFIYTICDLANNNPCKTAVVFLTVTKDSDSDTVLDIYDLDDDNDGILDIDESPSCFSCTLPTGATNTWTSYQTFSTDATLLPPAVDESAAFATQNAEIVIATKFPHADPFGFGIPWYNGMTLKTTNNAFGVIDELETTAAHSEWHVNMAIWQPPVAMANQSLRIRTNNNGFYGSPGGGRTESSKLYAMVNDGTAPMLSATAAIDANYNEVNLGNWNGTSCVILALHMFDQSLLHDNAVLQYWNGTDWTALPTGSVAPMPARIVGCTNDADGDGIPNHLDLDSDNDGCPDAVEGASTTIIPTNLVDSQMPGGNTGATSGTFNQPIVQNLGTTPVGSTASTMGIPTIAGTGQAVGTSKTANPVLLSGTASANQLIVSGTAPAAITLTGSTGAIQWQVSTDNVTFNNVASAGTTASYSPGTLTARRYYRAILTSDGGCTAMSNVVTISVCAAGTTAPVFNNYIVGDYGYIKSTSSYGIACGATTVDLSVLVASPAAPAGTTVTWHNTTPATDANKLTPAEVSALTGATRKVYAAFWDSTNGCYSPTKLVTVYAAICAVDDDYTATPIIFGVGGTLPSIFANDTYKGIQLSTLPTNSVIWSAENWIISNAQVDVTNATTYGVLTIPATLAPGDYEYLYGIIDNSPEATPNTSKSIALVRFRVVACTNPPNLTPATDFTKTGISDIAGFEGGSGWPGNVPNGFIAIESRNKGFVITRVANTSVIANPVIGMLVYDLSNSPTPCVKLYNGNIWKCIEKDCNPTSK